MIEQVLRSLGADSIHGAANGKEAMRLLRSTSIDVVISDLMMPDVDGIELIPMLCTLGDSVSLILCSSDEACLHTAMAIARASGVRLLGGLPKPVTPDRLRPLLQGYLDDSPTA
jgi:CheY-like chemotaxis protein